ncbi:hypothetical protein [Belnapia moabensis]|uniref:hypothetical protein n=1 Tax=Belnapia moabensis TaxID=365533 RepID=UPI0005BA08B7|nr:hypothetical protein [Belnapia moabensis]
MDRELHHHLRTLLNELQPLLAMAERDGVPGQAAAQLRAAAAEIENALTPDASQRRADSEHSIDAANAEIIRRGERERGAWGIDEA